jgi:hypothetical protein
VAPPVFKTSCFSNAAKMTNKTLGNEGSLELRIWPLQANSGHKNVYRRFRIGSPDEANQRSDG